MRGDTLPVTRPARALNNRSTTYIESDATLRYAVLAGGSPGTCVSRFFLSILSMTLRGIDDSSRFFDSTTMPHSQNSGQVCMCRWGVLEGFSRFRDIHCVYPYLSLIHI